ncbi:MAG: C25 family peptidase propeptide domain-containing protein, partial [Anaerolineae bacterium]
MRRCGLVLILVLAVLLPGSPWSRVHGAAAPASAGPHLVRSDESGVVLELSTPAYDLTTEPLSALRLAHHDAGSFQRLSVAGYDVTQEAGQPQLPVMNTLLGVPPDTQIELRILADDTTPLPGRHSLSPAPRPAPLTDDLQPGKLVFEPDQIAYTTDALYPALPARIAGEAWLRDQRIVRVEIYPFQYNPAMGTLLWHRRLRVEVRFTAPTPRPHTRQFKGAGLAKPLGLDTRLKPLLDRR